MENQNHNVLNFSFSKLDHNPVNEKLDQYFEKLDCAAKVNIPLGFVLREMETGKIVIYKVMKLKNSFIIYDFLY